MEQPARYTLHLFILSAFAFAQPVFDLLAASPEFFVVRQAQIADVVILCAALLLPIPLVLAGIEGLAGKINTKWRTYTHALFVICLVTLILLPLVKKVLTAGDSSVMFAAGLIGILFYAAYAAISPVRQFVSVLALALPVFLLLFLFQISSAFPRAGNFIATSSSSDVPVTVVILDELATTTLMDETQSIDAQRYPNFAAFAGDSHWFRNATAVSDSTIEAVPALLTGRYPPAEKQLPISSVMPNNIFSFLHASHRVNAVEKLTQICHPQICTPTVLPLRERAVALLRDTGYVYLQIVLPGQLAARFPSVSQNWAQFGAETERDSDENRDEQWFANQTMKASLTDDTNVFTRFINSIAPSNPPGANILHIVFPHLPYQHYPSGKKYNYKGNTAGLEPFTGLWSDDPWATRQHYQRYLMQLGYADKLLGVLLEKLKSTGLYDESLVIIISDHGASFQPGEYRRQLTNSNFMDILPVLFMAKLPGQRTPVVSDRNVETIDLLPTIADAIGRTLPFTVDGQSALDHSLPERSHKKARSEKKAHDYTFPAQLPDQQLALQRQLQQFGSAADNLFTFGPHADLIGRPLDAIASTAHADVVLRITNANAYAKVNTAARSIPGQVLGEVTPPALENPAYIAIAVNGTISAITRTYLAQGGKISFSAMLPETALRDGNNTVEAVFLPDPEGVGQKVSGKASKESAP